MAGHDAPEAPELTFRDEEGAPREAFVEAVAAAIEAEDVERLKELVEDLHEADLGDLIAALQEDARPRLIELLGPAFDFTALTELDETVRVQILEALSSATVAEGVRDLESDDAVYILEDLDAEDREEILSRLPPPERLGLQRALDFPEGAVGRRMRSDFIAVPPFWTVGQVIDSLRENEELPETFYEIFVVDPAYKLMGDIPLDRLLRAKRPTLVSTLVGETRRRVRATDDQEDVARLFERYNLVSAAVVDDHDRLVGVLTVDDVVDVMQEEADEDLKALGGVKGDEELSDSVLYIVRSRFGWLFINMLTALLAASVLGLFEGELQKMVALAVLAPVVASQGGNAATQTMTVTVRAIATRDLGAGNFLRVVAREVMVGLCNGLGLATITGIVAGFWFRSPDIGLVLGVAIVVNLLAAALAGILIPATLNRLGADPAVSSGTFVTTVTDVVGFFTFLSFASLWFGFAS